MKLRIRTFTILCLFFLLTVPWIFFLTANFVETQTLNISKSHRLNEELQRQVTETIHMIEANSEQWEDPDWQHRLITHLQKTEMDVVIQSASNSEIYRSNPERRSALSSIEQFSIIEDGQLLGRVSFYLPRSTSGQMMMASIGLLLAFVVIGMAMRRFLLKPLERMSKAARQIAEGDWDVLLPTSSITEIAEVRDGFEVMVKGLELSYRKQTELEEERRFVIAAVAHDLRTPLFALRGYLDGLEQGIAQSPEKIAKYIAVCKEKSAQLDRLVEDLFTFTKMEYLETKLNNKTMDFVHILQESIDSLTPQAREKHISLSTDFTHNCFISGDKHLLERAMNNILENAVRHTPSGGEMDVHCHRDDQYVRFTIRDSGAGFSMEELTRVFEPLYRGEASRSRSTGGSGLGLTISHRIMKQHGGELEASNHPQGGAVLAGWLPVASSNPKVEEANSEISDN